MTNTTPVSTKPGIDYPDTLEKVLARLDAGTWDPTLIYEAAKLLRSLSATPAPSVPLGWGEAHDPGECPEMNLSNYTADDVANLNDWAVRADAAILRLTTERNELSTQAQHANGLLRDVHEELDKRGLPRLQANGLTFTPMGRVRAGSSPADASEMSRELEAFRKKHWTHWNAAENLLIAHAVARLSILPVSHPLQAQDAAPVEPVPLSCQTCGRVEAHYHSTGADGALKTSVLPRVAQIWREQGLDVTAFPPSAFVAQILRDSAPVPPIERVMGEACANCHGSGTGVDGRPCPFGPHKQVTYKVRPAPVPAGVQGDAARRYEFLRQDAGIRDGRPFIAISEAGAISQWTGVFADQKIDAAMASQAGKD